MSSNKSTENLNLHKENALNSLEQYLNSLISSTNPQRQGKADKLSYWLEDYVKFLKFEEVFSSSNLKKYKRGEILKVHLGYNIGSEEGGLHYAVVVEKDNSIHNPVITIVPLTSIKPSKDVSRLRNGEVLLGNEIFQKFSHKFIELYKSVNEEHQKIRRTIKELRKMDDPPLTVIQEIEEQQLSISTELDLLNKMKAEISKMKRGSIALVNQITTISKIRIYDPRTTHDMLSGIKLSDESLDKIDKEIIKRYSK